MVINIRGQSKGHCKRAIANYKDFVRAGVGVLSLWTELRNQVYLGSDDFVAGMQKTIDRETDLTEVPRVQHRSKAKPIAHYQGNFDDPKVAMARAYLTGDYTMKQIADHFGVHYATVSRAVKKAEEQGVTVFRLMILLHCKT